VIRGTVTTGGRRSLAAGIAARLRQDYRVGGIEGVLFGASLPGAGLPLGADPGVLPVSGEVGGDADGVRSRLGLSPTRFESHAAASPVSRTNAQSPERTFFMVLCPPGSGENPYPLI